MGADTCPVPEGKRSLSTIRWSSRLKPRWTAAVTITVLR